MASSELVRYHTNNGVRAAIVQKGRKWIKVVEIDSPIHTRKVPLSDERYMTPLQRKGQDYPLVRARNKFLKAGRTLGITQGARSIINALA